MMSIGGDIASRHVGGDMARKRGAGSLLDLGIDRTRPFVETRADLLAAGWVLKGSGDNAEAVADDNGLVIRAGRRCDGFLLYAALIAEGLPEEISGITPVIHDLLVTDDGGLLCLMEEIELIADDDGNHLAAKILGENIATDADAVNDAVVAALEDEGEPIDDLVGATVFENLDPVRALCRRLADAGLNGLDLDAAPESFAIGKMGYMVLFDPVGGLLNEAQVEAAVARIVRTGAFPGMAEPSPTPTTAP